MLKKQIDLEEAIEWICKEVRSLDDADDICTIYNVVAGHRRVAEVIDNRWMLTLCMLTLREIEP